MGLYSDDVAQPLAYIENVSSPEYNFEITSKTNNSMTLYQAVVNHGSDPNYLGAIVSADGSEVYWINNLIS